MTGPLGVALAAIDTNNGEAGYSKPLAYLGAMALGGVSAPVAITAAVSLALLDAAGVLDPVSLAIDEYFYGIWE